MILGRYIPSQSWLHLLDPRTKIVSGIILATLVIKTDTPGFLAGLVFVLFILPLLTRLPWRITWGIQKSLWPLLSVVFLLNAYLTPGITVTIASHAIFGVTEEGLLRGGTLALKLNAIVLLFAWMTLTTSPSNFSDSLEMLLRPLEKMRIPTQGLILALAVALRFVPLILKEAQRLHLAQLSRGADFSGIRHLTRFVPILIPLFVATFTRAEHLTQTLDSRGYQHHPSRTHFDTLIFKRRDYLAFALVGCFATYMFTIL
ncbi:MAG: energy-coupling factor transporter transmembrane component T family protein [Candidatus Latescibacterota bacterium]